MKNFNKSKTKTSKAKTSKTKTSEYFLEESFFSSFSRQSISLASAESPCIMCVQYIGGCSVHRGVFSTSGGYHEYIGGIP